MRKLEITLGFFLLCIGLSAVGGGVALIVTKGLNMPVVWLAPVFESYLWPGIILAVVVGGTHLVASVLLFKKSPTSVYVAATAGFGLLIWEFVELYIITQPHWLQGLYFAFALLTLIAVLLLLKFGVHIQEKGKMV